MLKIASGNSAPSADAISAHEGPTPYALPAKFEDLCSKCASTPIANELVRHEASHLAMGTMFSVVAYGSLSTCLEDVLRQAFHEVDRLDSLMSNYKPDSELSTINRGAYDRRVAVTPELFNLLQISLRYSKETDGAFDTTIGPLTKSWGFFRGFGRLPSAPEIAELLKRIGHQHVCLDAATLSISFDQPGIELDLGAIGKGVAVDRVVAILRTQGISRALVSSGTSSIFALGSPPFEQGWEISLCDPLDRRKVAGSLRLQNLAISVSGDYEKSFELGGQIYAHIFDPRLGVPAEEMLMTVVISPSATEGDALSTAFFVEGVQKSQALLEHHPDLTAILFMPTQSANMFERVVLKSREASLNAECFLQM